MPRTQEQLEAPPLTTGSFSLQLGQRDVPNCSNSKIWMEVGTSRKDAEGSHDPEDAERTSETAWDVGLFACDCELACHKTLVSDDSSGCEANDNEAKDDICVRRRCDLEHEHVACEATENLQALGLKMTDEPATQQDIHQFTEWLDECQLRLASFHHEDVHAWIEGGVEGFGCDEQSQLQQAWDEIEDLRYELRSLCIKQAVDEVQAIAEASGHSDVETVVLQTRVMANAQVMAEWELWEPSTHVELEGLIEDKQVLERSNQRHLDQLQAQGYKVTLIPSKVIYSLKAPCGRRKCRLVACGNFLGASEGTKQAHKQVVYTASIGIEALRTGLAFSTRRGHTLITLDIKAAFLNAQLLPRDRKAAEDAVNDDRYEVDALGTAKNNKTEVTGSGPKEVVALMPPRMLVTKGFFRGDTRLIIKKAVYGLDQSPRDWALLRDAKLPGLRINCQGKEFKLFQSFADDSLWLIATHEPRRGFSATMHDGEAEEIAGTAVYVDDLLISADRDLAYAVSAAIQECWTCSKPQEVSCDKLNPARFLGIDLFWDADGNLVLSQESYITELGNRYESELRECGKPATPLAASFSEDPVEASQANPEELRRAQALVGELLWASIRTRPDVAFAVSKLASALGKAPAATYRSGLHTLAYLLGTSHVHLTYYKSQREIWNEYKRNPNPHGCVEGYGDASFAPEAKRSMQCVQVYVEGALVAWTVGRQPFMAQSSCEAEMIALMDLANFTISTSYLVDEFLQR